MLQLAAPQWGLAAAFAAVGLAFVAALKTYLRGKDVWRYDTRAAWLRGFASFSLWWTIAAATGTLATLADNPVVFPGQPQRLTWVVSTVAVVALIGVGYWYVWGIGTEPHGRRLLPDSVVFGVFWGVSEGLLYGSTFVVALRLLGGLPGGTAWAAVATVVVLSAFSGFWHALYWDIHVSPEHNVIEWNPKKVAMVHTPNLVFTTTYVAVFDNLAIWVGLQALALLGSSVRMPFPTFRHQHPQPPDRPVLGPPGPIANRIEGSTVVITGGASGVGAQVAHELSDLGARVVVLDRVASSRLHEWIEVDLADPAGVRAAAAELLATCDTIDVLICNAGVFRSSYEPTPSGVDRTLASNHLGHHLLVDLLEERLLASRARVIAVSSDAHWQAGPIDWDDVDLRGVWEAKGDAPNTGFAAYNRSKLMVTAAAMERARRWEGTEATINVVTPGAFVRTSIYDGLGGPMGAVIGLLGPVLRTPEEAARGYVYLATSPEVEGISGWYFKDLRPIAPSLLAQDAQVQAQVRSWSERAVAPT